MTAAQSSEPAVQIVGLSKRFERDGRSVEAIADLSLEVQSGEFVTVLGPSGCGKSTMLHIVGGFETPTDGVVMAHGEPVRGPGRDRGLVFQTPTLFPWKTIVKNVSWFVEVDGVGRRAARDRARELLSLVGLGDFADSYPSELSGGMRQRAALARTLALDPRVLLMDEPFGALDALTREQMQEELNRIWQASGLTVIFITHDINEAIFLGDRVVVMSPRPGRMIEDLRIDLPRPRHSDAKKSTAAWEYHGHFWDLLRVQEEQAAAR